MWMRKHRNQQPNLLHLYGGMMARKGVLIGPRKSRNEYFLDKFAISRPKKGVVRLRDRASDIRYEMSAEQFNQMRENTYRSFEQFEKAVQWRSQLGSYERQRRATENLTGIINAFDIEPEERDAIVSAFESLSDEEKVKFWQENEWLVRKTYDYYRELIDIGPEYAVFGEDISFGYLRDPKNRAILEKLGAIGKAPQSEIVNRLWSSLSKYGLYRKDFL